jgi:cytochrome c peroxidase
MSVRRVYIVLLLIVVTGIGWIQSNQWLAATHPVKLVVPKGWPAPVYDFKDNPLTKPCSMIPS